MQRRKRDCDLGRCVQRRPRAAVKTGAERAQRDVQAFYGGHQRGIVHRGTAVVHHQRGQHPGKGNRQAQTAADGGGQQLQARRSALGRTRQTHRLRSECRRLLIHKQQHFHLALH